MSIAPITPAVNSAPPQPDATNFDPAATRENNRRVANAVNVLNQQEIAGDRRAFSISIDPKSKLSVVKIVDTSTRAVIEQIPSQVVVNLADQIARGSS